MSRYRLRHGQLARWIKWRTCDVREAKEGLENELWRRWKQQTGWRMSCDVGKATEGLENELWRRRSDGNVGEWALLHYSSFSNPSVASPTSQFILQPFFRCSYVTISSLNSPGELPMTKAVRTHKYHHVLRMVILKNFKAKLTVIVIAKLILQPLPSLHLRHSSFSNPFVALPTSQLILQPFRFFTYVTVHSPTLLSLLLRHKFFT